MFISELMPGIRANEEQKEALKKKCIEEVVPKVFGALIKHLEKNGGNHFAGSQVCFVAFGFSYRVYKIKVSNFKWLLIAQKLILSDPKLVK